MKKEVGRRTPQDERWQECKRQVHLRDKNMCRFLKILSASEYKAFMESNPAFINLLECAHVKSVGTHPELCYDIDNIVLLNHTAHSRLDSALDPVTGKRTTKAKIQEWWDRILKG